MEVIALGTGTSQGIPLIGCQCETCTSTDPRDKRYRSSIYVSTDRVKIQVDIGPDFRSQYLENNLSTIDHVLFTHEHNDHVIGIDDLRAVNFIQRKSLPLYGEARVLNEIKKRFHYAFQDHPYPGVPDIHLHPITADETIIWEDIELTPIRIMHGELAILAYRFNDMAYITDASYIDEDAINKLQGLEVLIINALRKTPHYSHLNLEQALSYIERIKPRKAYITHVSHAMGPTHIWEQLLPPDVYPLEDKMRIKL